MDINADLQAGSSVLKTLSGPQGRGRLRSMLLGQYVFTQSGDVSGGVIEAANVNICCVWQKGAERPRGRPPAVLPGGDLYRLIWSKLAKSKLSGDFEFGPFNKIWQFFNPIFW